MLVVMAMMRNTFGEVQILKYGYLEGAIFREA
jgi:hypothetical protein